MSDRRFKTVVYLTALGLYLLGVWLHLPNGGGNVYTDITQVFQERFCQNSSGFGYPPSSLACNILVPYLQSFNEYPIITAMFMYFMGSVGWSIPGDHLTVYYLLSAAVLAIPTFLAIRELMKIIEIRGVSRNRILWYFIVTPTFIIMTTLNWYVIGVYFSLSAIRIYLDGGSRVWVGVLFGLSAASNFVTAIPALGFFIASKTMKERFVLALAGLGTYAAINAPFFFLNSALWLESWHYIYAWNIENSWMQAILIDLYSPYRHVVPPIVFGGFFIGMVWLRFRRKTSDPLVFAFLAMFGYTFATYIYTPQMNLILLPFFVLLPVTRSYREFLAFEILNASIIILGVSEVLAPFGINYYLTFHLHPIDYMSPVFWIEVVRSLWQGKFTLLNDIPGSLSLRWWKRVTSTPPAPGEEGAVLRG
ncbi:MAG TPA: hypothetical protein VND41_05135 [Nitrososphaerales archaeon]|nr:hypothetical protein [Nitrososphaerales archaeon]